MEKITWIVEKEQEGLTVKHMALKVAKLSQSSFRSLKFSGGIQLNGNIVHANERVCAGQQLAFVFHEKEHLPITRETDIALSILYEDDDYFVIDKPAPLATLRSRDRDGETLEDVLYHYLDKPKGYLFRPVNRLDKGTSGLMVAAKSAYAQQRLQKQLHSEQFIREYMALCDGIPDNECGTLDLPIGKEREGVKRCITPNGKEAVTHYEIIEKGKTKSLLRLRLETGRTHQIRVHLAAIGCPVTGDYLYGKEHPDFPGRFALHSHRVCMIQPVKNKVIEIYSDIPDSWRQLLKE